MFERKTYIERRSRLIAGIESGLILLLGNEESPMNYEDNVYPFRQDSNFLYYAGLDRPHLALLLDIEEGHATLFGEEPTLDHVIWMGPQASLAELAESSGIEHTAPYGKLAGLLGDAQKKGREVRYLPPYRHDLMIRLHQWLNTPFEALKDNASEELVRTVVAQRSVKTGEEIREMERAVAISGQMHVAAIKATRPGIRESRLAGIVEGIATAAGGQLAYPAIVTINGQTLHNHYHGNTLADGNLVLGDFGAETGAHYAGDITRTWPVSGVFSTAQKEIYQIVLDAQLAALDALGPGRRYLDIHLLASRTIAAGLKDLGLMKGDVEEAVAEGAHALFFPHGLGHMIGLDVHDMEDLGENVVGYGDEVSRSDQFGLRSLRLAKALQPGFALTIEPGIYFIPELIARWKEEGKFEAFIHYEKLDRYLGFSGVRIEDNALITEDGSRLLGPPIPKTVGEMEALRS